MCPPPSWQDLPKWLPNLLPGFLLEVELGRGTQGLTTISRCQAWASTFECGDCPGAKIGMHVGEDVVTLDGAGDRTPREADKQGSMLDHLVFL